MVARAKVQRRETVMLQLIKACVALRTDKRGVTALEYALIAGMALRGLEGNLLAGLGAAAVLFCLAALAWRRGWLGGGDVKLIGAAGLAVTPPLVPGFVVAVSFAGGVLALLYVGARFVVPA